jgi:hypothetical protein
MIGCLMLVPIAGFLTMMGIYTGALMSYFVAVVGALGAYASFMSAYFTAFFIIMFG